MTDDSHPQSVPNRSREADCGRRIFLARLSLALAGLSAAIIAIPVVGFVLGPLIQKFPRVWRKVGRVDDFKVGETVKVDFLDPSPLAWAGVTAQTAAWLRRVDVNNFIAFALNCTHLGCPVHWIASAQMFLCPCHGGVFYADGTVAAGPPQRPLVRLPVRVKDGQVEVLASAIPIAGYAR